ncbi:MAG: RNA polymerase sigma factor [bacterium]|nr:RNA polymerase sigma factor [bacterium]
METSLEDLVREAKQGNRDALETIVFRIQDNIYGLALRMLYHPADAEDATQEILVKIITRLDSFREESTFTTWTYRVSANHLLNFRKRKSNHDERNYSFEKFTRLIDMLDHSAPTGSLPPEEGLLVEEIKVSCMQGLLGCLNRDQRLAYILGDIFQIDGRQSAYILDISPAAFRKRRSRARKQLHHFMDNKCGLLNPAAPCRCERHVIPAIETDWLDPENLLFTGHSHRPPTAPESPEHARALNEIGRMAELFRSQPDYTAPTEFVEGLREMLDNENITPCNEELTQ